MADPINPTGTISSLIRAQIQAPLLNAKPGQDVTQTLQASKAVVPAKATAVALTSKSINVSSSGNLPRGSLVDKLV